MTTWVDEHEFRSNQYFFLAYFVYIGLDLIFFFSRFFKLAKFFIIIYIYINKDSWISMAIYSYMEDFSSNYQYYLYVYIVDSVSLISRFLCCACEKKGENSDAFCTITICSVTPRATSFNGKNLNSCQDKTQLPLQILWCCNDVSYCIMIIIFIIM